ncbi:class C beta-lactamase-related serine hydrolase [Loktanella sp. IMCC34160]|uniref:serine hydrolase domain-containing protein n=1 Tax=Loktanella sp. IMCC34160 TaxID=2510646 RepID=UPI00101DC4E4|nr:serine hydrolase [Loktanella sp. IMCC34160]RYG90635.1 class C beta-lactamase-related serine hydrolase [Loktanella sp. IMCC34160]
MRTVFKWVGRAALALVLAAAVVGFWKREEITRLLAVNSLFSEDRIVGNFSGMDGLFHTVSVLRGDGPVSPLPAGPAYDLPADVDQWIIDRNVTGLVVLHDGRVVHESYYLGTGADDLRISWSVAKSFLSALVGVLIEEGAIAGLDVKVTDYAPSLAGSAYDGATLRDVLQMSSGVTFDEDYLDFNSDINKMGRVLALGGSMDAFAAGQDESFATPGTVWQYVSIDTHVIGMVVRGATGRDIPGLLAEKIIAPLGLEADPLYLTDGYGVAFVLGGLNLRTRDYARFGQMIAQGGMWQGQQIVPAEWIDASTRPSAKTAQGATGYGYQWWVPVGATPGEEFFARGIYGQYIYIDRARNVVIAVNSADRLFREPGVHEKNIQILRTIARDL